MVDTLAPNLFSIFVQSFAELTFLKSANISLLFLRSVLLKTIPVFESEGLKVTSAVIPLCKPIPEKFSLSLIVFWYKFDSQIYGLYFQVQFL